MNTISSFLIFCSGVNREILTRCPKHEHIRQIGMGGVIFGTAALAFCSGGYALYTVFKGIWIALIFGLVWALIIFNLDRFFISTFNKNGGFLKELRSGVPRIILAVIIGLTISEPLKLKLFESEINEQLHEKLQSQKAEIISKYDSKIAELKRELDEKNEIRLSLQKEASEEWKAHKKVNDAEIGELRNRLDSPKGFALGRCGFAEEEWQRVKASNKAEISRMKEAVSHKDSYKQELYKLHLLECSGRAGTMIKGEGPECIRTRKAYETARTEWKELEHANSIRIAELEDEIAEKNDLRLSCYEEDRDETQREWEDMKGEHNARIAFLENETAEKEDIMRKRHQGAEDEWQEIKQINNSRIAELNQLRNAEIRRAERFASDGFLARHLALNRLTEGNEGLWMVTLLITLLFVMIETVPVIAKWMQIRGPYDYMLQTVNNGFISRQQVIQNVEKNVTDRELYEYLKATRIAEIRYEEVMVPYKNCRTYLDDLIEEFGRSDERFEKWISQVAKIKASKLKQKRETGIESMTERLGEAQDISFEKFREMLGPNSNGQDSLLRE